MDEHAFPPTGFAVARLHVAFASAKFQVSHCNSFQSIHCFHFFSHVKASFQNRPSRKIGQGDHWVIFCTNYDGLMSLMLHTKLCENPPTGSREEDF